MALLEITPDGIAFRGSPEEEAEIQRNVAAFFDSNPDTRLTPEEFVKKFDPEYIDWSKCEGFEHDGDG